MIFITGPDNMSAKVFRRLWAPAIDAAVKADPAVTFSLCTITTTEKMAAQYLSGRGHNWIEVKSNGNIRAAYEQAILGCDTIIAYFWKFEFALPFDHNFIAAVNVLLAKQSFGEIIEKFATESIDSHGFLPLHCWIPELDH